MVLSLKINIYSYICKIGCLNFVSDPGVMFRLFKMPLALIYELEPLPKTNQKTEL